MASNTNEPVTISKDMIPKITNTFDMNELLYDIFDRFDNDDAGDNKDGSDQDSMKLEKHFSLDFNFDYIHNNMEQEEEIPDDDVCLMAEHVQNAEITDDDEKIEIISVSNPFLTRSDHRIALSSLIGQRKSGTKKMHVTTINNNDGTIDPMPVYLMEKTKLFDQLIGKQMKAASTMTIEDVRQIAFFTHYFHFFTLLHQLWSIYLKAGIGQLKNEHQHNSLRHRPYWCQDVQLCLRIQQENGELPIEMTKEDEQSTCEMIVNRRLNDYSQKIEYYRKELQNRTRKYFVDFIPTLEEKVELFVEKYGISFQRQKYQFITTMLNYNYDDHLLQDEYEQENPNGYQLQTATYLYDLHVELENGKCDYLELRQRILCHQPLPSLDRLEKITILDRHGRQQWLRQYDTLIQQTKTDLMGVYLAIAEQKIAYYQAMIKQTKADMYGHHHRQVPGKMMTQVFINLLNKRIDGLKEKMQIKCQFLLQSYRRQEHTSNHQWESLAVYEQESLNVKSIGFLPTMMIDLGRGHGLTDEQLRLLNRGPTYVSPCQFHISSLLTSSTMESMDNLIKIQLKPLLNKMSALFSKYKIDLSISETLKLEMKKEFETIFSVPIPADLATRAIYEKKLIQSIQHTLKKNNLILRRTADQYNRFYLGSLDDFYRKSHQYMQHNKDHYHVLCTMKDHNQQQINAEIQKIVQQMNFILKKLCQDKQIDDILLAQLQVHIEDVKLPYLYFLPDVSTSSSSSSSSSMEVKPMMSAQRSATSKLATFLHRLLQPLMTRSTQRTLILNEADFIQKLHAYTYHDHHLHPTTLFATINMDHFPMMFPHSTMLETLENFFTDHLDRNRLEYRSLITTNEPQLISVHTIKKLTKLFLENNIFYYHGTIYQCVRGAPPNSFLLNETLANIYLCQWEQVLYKDIRLKNEFYGRYNNQIFLTWNRSPNELHSWLKTMTEQYPHLQMQISMGRCVQFFNAQIENRHGQLYTSVFYPANIPKYTLPYVVDHAQMSHRHWFRSALVRAVRFCTNLNDFNRERLYLEMSCLANGYSIDFIETQLNYFYRYFNVENQRFHINQLVYNQIRQRSFELIEKQHRKLKRYQECQANERIIYLYYRYDYGFEEKFRRLFYHIWSEHLVDNSHLSHLNTKIILYAKHLYSLNALLAQQKPSYHPFMTKDKSYS